MAMEDTEVRLETWTAKLPIQFVLADDEVVSIDKPKPYYLLVPRLSYFPLVIDKALRYFDGFVDSSSNSSANSFWLEYDSSPLKWHYPIGVLADLLLDSSKSILPWQITLHYKKFPSADLISFKSRDAVEAFFMHAVKEADQLKHQGKIFGDMRKNDHKQLWSGFANDKFEQFWSINRKLAENSDRDPIRYIPLRVYLPNDQPYIQMLCKPLEANGERSTLTNLAEILVSDVGLTFEPGDERRFVSHGIDLPMETPLLWLCENMSYPDNFVHLIYLPRT